MTAENAQIDQLNNVAVVTMGVEAVKAATMQPITQELLQRLRYHNASHFVLDMKGVSYIDSSALGALVQFQQEAQHVRGRIALANCGAMVAAAFKVTRLDTLMEIYDDVPAACEGVARG